MGLFLAQDGGRLLTQDGGRLLTQDGEPSGYPDGDLDARVELPLGEWTDITTAALPDGLNYAKITSGQPDGAQQPNPALMPSTWDNADGRFSPRNVSGPYYGLLRQNTPARVSVASPYGACLRLEADSQDKASVADTAALHITGSMELRIELRLSDYRACNLAARNDGTVTSWGFTLNDDGTLLFNWRDAGGTLWGVTSAAAVGVNWGAVRVTVDASNGNVQFFLGDSIDGPWTPLGAPVSGTGGAATSIRAGNSPLITGWSAAYPPAGRQMRGQVSGLRLYNGLADSGGTIAADAAFSAQVPGTVTWTDSAGLTWTLSGGAEITARDYRLHGELSSVVPQAQQSGTSSARVQAKIMGRLHRLQQPNAAMADSPLKRAVLSQAADLYPVAYWPMEDGAGASVFGPALNGGLPMTFDANPAPHLASDSSFLASAPLPQLNGSRLQGKVAPYASGSSIVVRFLAKLGTLTTLPGLTYGTLLRVTSTGTVRALYVTAYAGGALGLIGYDASGNTVVNTGPVGFSAGGVPLWYSAEIQPVSGGVQYSIVTLAPGASTGTAWNVTLAGATVGNCTGVTLNPNGLFTDTVVGHLSVQKAWTTMFALGQPLNAWQGELAADRFARVCAENGIACRILGSPSLTQPMGPQPRGSVWEILRDCANAGQGLVFEPRDCFGVGFRTLSSMLSQSPAVTLSFAQANLPGAFQGADDDLDLVNDVTASMPDGTTYRVVLDDGSPASVSDPQDGGAGRYAAAPPFSINVATVSQLADAAGWYLGTHTVDEARYRQLGAHLGIPGAPAAAIARLRPGDLVTVTDVPAVYQTDDIRQLAVGATEVLGPGREITWDCVPASPYDVAVYDDPVYGRADTDGSALAVAVSTTATTLSVKTTGPSGIPWTTDPADFPFDIAVAGERMTVTGISGTSSPQSFTVTRSVNGVVKTQAADADVRLWSAPVYSLA